MGEREGGAGQIAALGGSGRRDRAGAETLGAAGSLSSPSPRAPHAPQRAEDAGKQEAGLRLHHQDCGPSRERGRDRPMSPPPSQTPGGAMAGYSHPLLLVVALQSLLQTALGQATNGSTATPTPASGLTESERLAAIIVPSLVGGLLLIGLVIFGALKVRERRQTEGTYRPSNEEQVGARVVTNANLQLPPEERLI
ncbi:protein crumbs homolog 3 isoform X1 [Mauremys reevesii]|uniref:protein crumbs homolog 3 isoform X1 n=1 Tax=Mauremys reevesii TaxID=260615 RepID=UPI00194011C2|nr:protein crumbs homolog 3 isoform X1 [Mauremys reevesii]